MCALIGYILSAYELYCHYNSGSHFSEINLGLKRMNEKLYETGMQELVKTCYFSVYIFLLRDSRFNKLSNFNPIICHEY